MSFETLKLLQNAAAERPGPEPANWVEWARQQAGPATGPTAAEEAAERAASAEERAESLALVNRQLGDPLGELSLARSAAATARDEVSDLLAKLEKARGKLARAQDNVQFWARRAEPAMDSLQRSAVIPGLGDLPDQVVQFEVAQRAAHREYVQRSRAAWKAATTPGRARPFSRGGAAVRSEQVTCDACLTVGATPEESFLIHHTDADGNPLSADTPVRVPPGETDRSAGYDDWLPCPRCGVPADRCTCSVAVR